MAFFDALARYGFLQNALLAGLLASALCGVVGPYVVARRMTFLGGAIAHAVLGGVGLAVYWGLDPFVGALPAAVLCAVLITLFRGRAGQHEDMLTGALWAVGMSVGVLLLSRVDGYQADLSAFLFGNLLLVGQGELWWMAGLTVLVGLVFWALKSQFLAVSFDAEHARLVGLPVAFLDGLMLSLVAVSVVALMRVAGLVLVMAMLSLPAAMALRLSRRLPVAMLLCALLCGGFTTGGLALSYGPDLPPGATVVLLMAAGFVAQWLWGRKISRPKSPA